MAIFAGLIVIFLQRSTGEVLDDDPLWSYFPPSVGCAISNYLGNKGVDQPGFDLFDLGGILGIVAVLVYIYYVIKPIPRGRP